MSYNLKKTFEWYYNLEDKNDFFSSKDNIQKWLTEEGQFYRRYYGKRFENPDYRLKVMYNHLRKIIPKLKFLSQIGVLDPENTGFELKSSSYFYISERHFDGCSPETFFRVSSCNIGAWNNFFLMEGAYEAILLYDQKSFTYDTDSLYREGKYSTLHILNNNDGIFLTSVKPEKALLLPNWSWKDMKQILKFENEAREYRAAI